MAETILPAKPGILTLAIKEKSALYAAYMPFVKGGGLFVPTTRQYNMGDTVFMLLSILNDTTKTPISGKVVWITQASVGRSAGVGLQFDGTETGASLKNKIEGVLAGILDSAKPTNTF